MNIKMENIYKSFGQNKVLKGVNIEFKSGEIHAIMGENGAGKSTLMNILSGSLKMDKGKIFIDGKETIFKNINESKKNIAFIHQELNIFDNLTILENLFINEEIISKIGFIKKEEMKKIAKNKLNEINLDLNLDLIAENISVGQKQMVEIIRALMSETNFIIMDEPTAALTIKEADKLFVIMKKLKKQGVGIIYISHRMEEIFKICDVVSVMRDGETISTNKIQNCSNNQIIKEMVGRDLDKLFPERYNSIEDKEVLRVENLSSDKLKIKDINFNLKKGEILGISGLMGAGRTEIARLIFGLEPKTTGEIYCNGKKVIINSPNDAIQNEIAFISEDRKNEGLLLDFSISQNISLPSIDLFTKNGLIDKNEEEKFVGIFSKILSIKMDSVDLPVSSLSGGNQQKVVIAKWLGKGPRIIILDEPTRGIDVLAKYEIYQLMNELTKNGVSVIMISSELPEIIGMSDRVLVIYEGTIQKELLKEELNQQTIMHYCIGGE